ITSELHRLYANSYYLWYVVFQCHVCGNHIHCKHDSAPKETTAKGDEKEAVKDLDNNNTYVEETEKQYSIGTVGNTPSQLGVSTTTDTDQSRHSRFSDLR